MDEQVQKTFDDLAAGGPPGDLSGMGRKLLYACIEAGGDPDPERRLASLRVCANLEVTDRVRVIDALIRDNDPRVRRYAFNLACAAERHGIDALRTAVNGDDIELAVDALGLIVTQLDKPSSMHARSWLRHTDPRIRAGAAMLLGNVSGPAMAVHLGRIAETDPVAAVRVIAAEAVGRCTGEEPKLESRDFWVEGPVDLNIDLSPPAPAKPATPPRLPKKDANLATLYPEDMILDDDDEPPKAPPADLSTLVPQAAEGTEEVREAPRDWRKPAPMPSTLPSEPAALVKLYGMVRTEDRAAVLEAFQATNPALQAQTLSGWTPGADPGIGRGIALVVKALGTKTHASMLRVMLREEDAGVRAAAGEAIGATGTLSMIPQLSQLLRDDDADVRQAAVGALAELLVRMERFAMLRDQIEPMKADPDDAVKAAAEAALQRLP